jgi:hypothetical protein
MTPSIIRNRARHLGYTLRSNRRDCFGRKHAWSTSPGETMNGGPTNYFSTLESVARYLAQVEQVRSWQVGIKAEFEQD